MFEDFCVDPAHRGRGVARQLAVFALAVCSAATVTVGCVDCDVAMYRKIGFEEKAGNLLAWHRK